MNQNDKRVGTGVEGLNEVLYGGYIPNRSYLVRGGPGCGKTTLGMHFLIEGIKNEENALFISLTESKEKIIEESINRLGEEVKSIEFLDLSPTSSLIKEGSDYDIFHPGEVEWEPIAKKIINKVKEVEPDRIFLDCITQLYHLNIDQFQFRKKILSLTQFVRKMNSTFLISSEAGTESSDEDMQFISDGIINLEHGLNYRNLSVIKFRKSNFKPGEHTVKLTNEGLEVYPILEAPLESRKIDNEIISSGIPELDELLHGGIERGTDTILSGPSGVGKTTLGIQFMKEAAGRGEHSVVYTFEESVDVLIKRCEAINIPIKNMIEKGTLSIKKIDPIKFSPNEFAQMVRTEVEENGTTIVMIDSISGFRLSFPDNYYNESDIVRNLHSISTYLTNKGVTVILVNEVEAITGGAFKATDFGISYLADNLIFLRFLEINGEINKAIGVLKKRLSDFQKKLRRFEITSYGIKVGPPIKGLQGILTGSPEFVGEIDIEHE